MHGATIKMDITRLYTWNDLVQKTKIHVGMWCQKKTKITKLYVKRVYSKCVQQM